MAHYFCPDCHIMSLLPMAHYFCPLWHVIPLLSTAHYSCHGCHIMSLPSMAHYFCPDCHIRSLLSMTHVCPVSLSVKRFTTLVIDNNGQAGWFGAHFTVEKSHWTCNNQCNGTALNSSVTDTYEFQSFAHAGRKQQQYEQTNRERGWELHNIASMLQNYYKD